MRAPMVVKRAAILLLLHLVLFHVASSSAVERRQRPVLLQERETLLAFKRGLTLLSPSVLASWNESNGEVCGFTGVACDRRRQHVVGLSLHNMSISGTIPHVLGNLSHLRSLNMSNNHISGAIPPVLGNLSRLRSIDMSNNHISGAIPPSIGDLTRLQDFDMSNNYISGDIPPSIGNLTRLQDLDMSYNNITGTIPPVLGNMSYLTSIDMSNNQISGAIPPSIGNLTRLQDLIVSKNYISGDIPPSIGNLTRLQNLDMSYNNIFGAIPPVLGNLSYLTSIDMSNNFLTGKIPAELHNLCNLGELNLGNNDLSGGIPPSFSELAGIWYLSLEHNSLSGHIPAAIFQNWTILGVVNLGDNALSGEIPRDAGSGDFARRFAALNLYSNKLTGRLPRWLANCTKLVTLDVENNSLTDELPTGIISGKKYLTYLHLSNNVRFSSHDGNTNLEPFFAAVSNCSWMMEIQAAAVGIGGRLPSRLGFMLPPNMSQLNLELNEIEGPIPADVGDVINITLMNLSSNHLNGTIPASICALQKLERLSLSNNNLTGEIPPSIGNATGLGELDLSGNALSGSIPSGIGNLTLLQYLYLQRNNLSGEIPATLAGRIGLLVLDLSTNHLTGDVPELGSGSAIIYLNLSRNRIGGELPPGLGDMEHVKALDLSWNNFTGAFFHNLGGCVELEVLDVSHNSLTGVLPESSLDRRENLKSLDVSNNSLTGEIPTSLGKCTSLTHLNLSYNDFVGAVPTTGAFSRFTFVSYIGNPRLCGPVVRRSCRRQHRPWYQSRRFLAVMCVCAAALAFALTIVCAISVRKIRDRLAAVREDVFRGRRSGGSSPVMNYKFPRITYRELVEATGEFSPDRLIGTGSYGRVYRGTLRDGTMVAVKVLQLQSGNSTKSFSRECQVLKRIRHRNLMRIVTACSLADFKALVLPFMANGSLERCLYADDLSLALVQRVNICSDIAEGMAYLHHHSPVKVIHCDLKPSNVLINDDMTALVSDFGISRLVMTVGGVATANTADVGASTANMLCGSIGYIPPEYGYGSNPTTKGDVYSFGVLVLEMATRRKPTDDMFEAGLSLHKWVKSHFHGRADVVVDPALAAMVRDQTPEVRRMSDVAIGELLELGILCTQESASARPTMMDAADDLDRLKRYLGGDTTATFASSLGFSSTTIEDIDD